MAPLHLLLYGPSSSVPVTTSAAKKRKWSVLLTQKGSAEEFSLLIKDPWGNDKEQELEWYLQDYPKNPLLNQGRAAVVSRLLKGYGRNLAGQIKACPLLQSHRGELLISIIAVAEACSLQRLHWELLEDADAWAEDRGQRFTKITVERAVSTDNPSLWIRASGKKDGQKHRILFVVSRRTADGQRIDDIDSTLVAGPVFAHIKKKSLLAEGDILRPPTWKAFEELLMSRPVGYYDVVHFDMHGHVDRTNQRYARWWLSSLVSVNSCHSKTLLPPSHSPQANEGTRVVEPFSSSNPTHLTPPSWCPRPPLPPSWASGTLT